MRNRIFTALLAVAVVVLIYLLLAKEKKEGNTDFNDVVKEYVTVEVEKVVKQVDSKGFDHAVIEDKENVIRSLKELNDSSKMQVDSLTKLLNIKDRQLKNWVSYSATLEDSLVSATKVNDSLFRYSGKNIKIEFLSGDKPSFNYSYDATVNYAEYWKRDWFLGKKKHYIDFWIEDEKARINGVKRVSIQPRDKSFGISLNAGGLYTDRLNIGFDAEIKTGKVYSTGGYYYDILQEKWRPVIGVKFRLLEF